jgi:L-alanine-DL-glutamate epimerase-like enolase superfamily enzyme
VRVARLDAIPVSVPYTHREVSSMVARDGVSDVIVRIESDDGQVGWGEACSGADTASIAAAIAAMTPLVVGRDPWNAEAIRADLFHRGLWQFRSGTGNFAFAGIDMALADLCARSAGLPLHRLFGGLRQGSVSYLFYLARGSAGELQAQCAAGLAAGFEVFYLKVGLDEAADLELVAQARGALGDGPLLRLDANGAWSSEQALRMLHRLEPHDIDFVEQPVRDHPVRLLAELRERSPVAICANEGLWSEAEAYDRIRQRQADVYCFSPYWVGSLAAFHRLAHVAHLEGARVCKHTHGELGIAAAACHQLLLTLPNGVDGHQQTAHVMAADVLREPLPIASGPDWGVPEGDGIGVEVDPDAVREAAERYAKDGQFRPWQEGR